MTLHFGDGTEQFPALSLYGSTIGERSITAEAYSTRFEVPEGALVEYAPNLDAPSGFVVKPEGLHILVPSLPFGLLELKIFEVQLL